jgi:hypothetical protein
MRELKLKYFIELASNIGQKARTEAQAVEQSQRAMQQAVDKTSGSLRGLDSAFMRFSANSATERQIGYMQRLGQGIDQARAKMRGLAELSASALQKAPAAAAGAVGAFYAAKTLMDKPMDYSLRLAHMANTAFGDRNLAGRQTGKAELNEAIMAAVRQGGGTRDAGAATLDSLIASGAVPIETAKTMLPALMKASSASGAGAEDIGKIAIKAMQTFKISESQLPEILDIAMKGGQAGGFELKDMAKWLPQMMAAGKLSGLQGVEGFRRIVAGAQASAITSGSKDEAGNNVVNLLAKLNSQDTQKDFAKEGFDLTGSLVDARAKGVNSIDAFVQFVDQIAAQDPQYVALQKKLAGAKTAGEKTDTLEALTSLLEGNAVGKVIQDRQALMYLLAEMNNRKYVTEVMDKTRAPGSAIDSAQALIQGESSYKFQAAGNEKDNAMSNVFNGKSGVLNNVLDGATGLAREFPVLTTATVAAATALGILATSAGLFSLLLKRNAGGPLLPGAPGGGPLGKGGSPGAFPALEGAKPSAAAKAGGLLGKLGLIGSVAAMGYELFGTSDEDLATLNAADARKDAMKYSRGKGFNDPRLLTLTSPGAAEQTLTAGQPTKIELGEGKLTVDVRMTDERTTASAQVTQPMSGVKVSAGATQPQGSW